MTNNRITKHPILRIPDSKRIVFSWNHQKFYGYTHDTVASALIANGIHIFGHHHKDHAPQGLFCANGQCAQCTVLINGIPQKACMTQLKEGMQIQPLEGLPDIAELSTDPDTFSRLPKIITPEVLIIGGGPAGLAAAAQLGEYNLDVLVVDDKAKFGGKLVLQTHRFFGSAEEVHAGHRGIEIAEILVNDVEQFSSVKLCSETKAVAVFEDKTIGLVKKDQEYLLAKPKTTLFATGAREKTLIFPGNTLPGVIGAGAFQTLVNRDLVLPGKSIFIVGGGNVGLIAGYHALQAGMEVKGLIEAQTECGGYQVHRDKLRRLGVPILTSHTVIAVNGEEHVESITIAKCNDFVPIPGTEQTIACDTVLIAVGLNPVNELFQKAQAYNMECFVAGDAEEIAEASAAMITGKIAALRMLEEYGYTHSEKIPALERTAALLKLRPHFGQQQQTTQPTGSVYPIFHCEQEIPCDPCSSACPIHNIIIPKDNILAQPKYLVTDRECINCGQCISICPGLAITIVNNKKDKAGNFTEISLPIEFLLEDLPSEFKLTDNAGNVLYQAVPLAIQPHRKNKSTLVAKFSVPSEIAPAVTGFRLQNIGFDGMKIMPDHIENETIICRCERVSAGEIRTLIAKVITDINQIKAITRAGMGACGSKTCHNLIQQLLRESGIPFEKIVINTSRPLLYEVDFQTLANQSPERDE